MACQHCIVADVMPWVRTGKELPQLPPERQPLTAVQEAGDVLFVPAGWSHAILNLREGIGLAEEFELSHW